MILERKTYADSPTVTGCGWVGGLSVWVSVRSRHSLPGLTVYSQPHRGKMANRLCDYNTNAEPFVAILEALLDPDRPAHLEEAVDRLIDLFPFEPALAMLAAALAVPQPVG